jgi:ketosteroid isomerase-like protein
MTKRFSTPLGATLLVAVVLAYQPPAETPQGADQAEVEAVVQVVHDLFDGMREKDADKIRGVFTDGARLAGLGRDGTVGYTDAADFAMSITRFEGTADERVWDWEVQIDGNLAQVWTKYDILIRGEFSHCGIDAFQMFKMEDGWKIFHLADTRHTGPDCWRYPGGEM